DVAGAVVEARELADERLEEAATVGVEPLLGGGRERVEMPVPACDERLADLAEEHRALVEQMQLARAAAKDVPELLGVDLREPRAVEHADAVTQRSVEGEVQAVGVGVRATVGDEIPALPRLEVGVCTRS